MSIVPANLPRTALLVGAPGFEGLGGTPAGWASVCVCARMHLWLWGAEVAPCSLGFLLPLWTLCF